MVLRWYRWWDIRIEYESPFGQIDGGYNMHKLRDIDLCVSHQHNMRWYLTINWDILFCLYLAKACLFSRQRIFFFRFIEVDRIQCRYFIMYVRRGCEGVASSALWMGCVWVQLFFFHIGQRGWAVFFLFRSVFKWNAIMFFGTEINMSNQQYYTIW